MFDMTKTLCFSLLVVISLLTTDSRYVGLRLVESVSDLTGGWCAEEMAVPRSHHRLLLLNRSGFSAGIDSVYHQARWVAYLLTSSELKKKAARSNRFYTDNDARGWVARDEDYRRSGFDRGHLAPAADMAWSVMSMRESFGFSNISPQRPAFNRGIWKKLEEAVRGFALRYDSVWIATGPVFTSPDTLKVHSRITVPGAFYKALMIKDGKGVQCIGFVIPNQASSSPLSHYQVAVDSVESLTQLDFFSLLPDSLEIEAEARFDSSFWL